jgi:hypothetical protein
MSIKKLNIKVDIEKMKLSEQETFENLSGCQLFDLPQRGITGRRLAALIYIFAKREDDSVTFEDCLELDMSEASKMVESDDVDPKELTD